MTQDTVNAMTVGIDIGDQHSHFCVLDNEGETLEEGRLKTTEEAFAQRFGDAARLRIAIEASTHSPWIARISDSKPLVFRDERPFGGLNR